MGGMQFDREIFTAHKDPPRLHPRQLGRLYC